MGVVTLDLHKKEREWRNLTLSDFDTVKYLLLYRSKVDVSYSASTNINIEQAGDIYDFNQELISLYASLDKLIEECKFKEKQSRLLELIFEGNTIQDICAMDIGYKRSATYDLFGRMVAKIIKLNNENWKESMEIQGLTKSSQ